MRFVFGKQDMPSLERTREQCWLLANGLGGFASLTGAFSASRLDHSVLMAAVSAPAVSVPSRQTGAVFSLTASPLGAKRQKGRTRRAQGAAERFSTSYSAAEVLAPYSMAHCRRT